MPLFEILVYLMNCKYIVTDMLNRTRIEIECAWCNNPRHTKGEYEFKVFTQENKL